MIICSQVTADGTAIALAAIPAGVTQTVISNAGTAPIFIGSGTAVTTSTGAPVAAGDAVALAGYPSSAASTLYVIAGVPSVPVGVLVSVPR